jgi:5-methylcytosine-specific restriction endonuclease McrA
VPKFFCYDCGKVSDQRKCPQHRIKKKYYKKPKTVTYAQRKYRKEAVQRHIDQYGYVCSGYKRKPHFSTDLTADHPIPTSKGGDDYQTLEIYCRSCNSSKQATI